MHLMDRTRATMRATMKKHSESNEPGGISYSSLRDSTHAHEALCELICAYCNNQEIGESPTGDEPSAVVCAFGIYYLGFEKLERLAVLMLILEGFRWNDSNFEDPS